MTECFQSPHNSSNNAHATVTLYFQHSTQFYSIYSCILSVLIRGLFNCRFYSICKGDCILPLKILLREVVIKKVQGNLIKHCDLH